METLTVVLHDLRDGQRRFSEKNLEENQNFLEPRGMKPNP